MKKIVSILLALLMLAALMSFSACGKKDEPKDPEAANTEAPAEITEEPTEAPTAEPTAEPTSEPHFAVDPSIFDRPLADVCTFALEPSIANFKPLFPEDFFISVQDMLEEEFAVSGTSYEDLGIKDFDAFLELMFDPETLAQAFSSAGRKLTDISFTVTDCEDAGVQYILDHYGELLQYIDPDNITAGYRVGADCTVTLDDGTTKTEHNDEMYFYVYDDVCYILFA